MRKTFTYLLMAMFLCASLGFAESVSLDMDVDDSSVGVKINIDEDVNLDGDSTVKTTVKSTISEETNDFKLIYEKTKNGATTLKILAPENATAQIFTESKIKFHSAKIPTVKSLPGGKYYIIKITNGDKKFIKKFEAKKGMAARLWVKSFGGKPADISVKVSVKEEIKVQSVSDCEMDSSDFDELLSQLVSEDFSDDKKSILQTAVKGNCFSIHQVKLLLLSFDFEDDRIEVAKLLYPTISNKSQLFKIYTVFEFSSSKDEFKEWVNEQ